MGKPLDKKEFDRIKSLTELAGVSNAVVSNLTKRSEATVVRIKASSDCEDYKRLIQGYSNKYYHEKMLKEQQKSVPALKHKVPSLDADNTKVVNKDVPMEAFGQEGIIKSLDRIARGIERLAAA